MESSNERYIGAVERCFPVSEEAVERTRAFFAGGQNPHEQHKLVSIEMLESHPVLLNALLSFVQDIQSQSGDSFNEDMSNGLVAGMTMGYKLIKIQTELNGAELPVPSADALDGFIADLSQSSHDESDTTTNAFIARRINELASEDPVYLEEFIAAHVSELMRLDMDDRAYFLSLGAIISYDIIKKQAYAVDLHEQFSR